MFHILKTNVTFETFDEIFWSVQLEMLTRFWAKSYISVSAPSLNAYNRLYFPYFSVASQMTNERIGIRPLSSPGLITKTSSSLFDSLSKEKYFYFQTILSMCLRQRFI